MTNPEFDSLTKGTEVVDRYGKTHRFIANFEGETVTREAISECIAGVAEWYFRQYFELAVPKTSKELDDEADDNEALYERAFNDHPSEGTRLQRP